jgi:tRNA (cmo5U34)-methyltransferase
MAIEQAFNETIEYYDSWIRKAVPGYDDLFSIALELLPFADNETIEVLDLGAGTGLFSRQVLDKCPQGRFVLYDVAGKMLDVARERFRDYPDRFRYVVDDYRNLAATGSFDLVISSLSIHHLADEEKKELCGRIFAALRDGGIFINIDLIKGPTPALEEFYCNNWYDKMRRTGASEDEIQAGLERRHAFDREALLEDQLRWLRQAGFTDVDCVYRNFKMGLFYAVKSPVSARTHPSPLR